VSDARPITNVTEFVCGACWNSFSRADDGVLHGDSVICPHCGHQQPLHDGDGNDLADLVRNAPRPSDAVDSGPFGFDDVESASGFVASEDTAPGEVDGEGGVQAPGAADALAAAGHRATIREEQPAGFVVGDVDPEDAFSGPTTVTQGSSRLQVLGEHGRRGSRSDFAAETLQEGSEEIGEALGDRRDTSPEIPSAAIDDIEAASGDSSDGTDPEIAAPEALAENTGSGPHAAVRVTVDGDEFDDTDTMEVPSVDEEEVEPKDWKIKAPPGLTYNFHSLDAMLGWAATKSGLDMQVSINGEDWHAFESFLEAIRAGLTPMRALSLAAEGGEVSARIAAIKEAPQLSAFDEIQQVDAREEVRQRFSGSLPEDDDDEWESVEVILDDEEADEEDAQDEPEEPDAAAAAGHRLQPPVSPAPSRRMSAVKPSDVAARTRAPTGEMKKTPLTPKRSGPSMPVLLAIGLAVLIAAAAAVHFTGVYRIPGLPF